MNGKEDQRKHQMKSKVIKLKPPIKPNDDFPLMNSVAIMLGDIDEQINQHFEKRPKDKDRH